MNQKEKQPVYYVPRERDQVKPRPVNAFDAERHATEMRRRKLEEDAAREVREERNRFMYEKIIK